MSPRYDIPKAAPEPLRQVQLLINTLDLEHEADRLADWLHQHGIKGKQSQARALREALRDLVLANNGTPIPEAALTTLNRAAARIKLRLDADADVHLTHRGEGDALDEVAAIAIAARLDGSLTRLKACRNCRWCFYDTSPNRSATWCSMKICGNRSKVRTYRNRHKGKSSS